MNLTTSRESLLRPLQAVIGVVERRQTMPILANVLMVVKDDVLAITATDLEVGAGAASSIDEVKVPGEITVPARKLLDICRALPEESTVHIQMDGDRMVVKSGRSRFCIVNVGGGGLSNHRGHRSESRNQSGADGCPPIVGQDTFSMAQQDVRYYLNGLLLETVAVLSELLPLMGIASR